MEAKIDAVRQKMKTAANKAHTLYTAAKVENPGESVTLLDPETWILNQPLMRDLWEHYKAQIEVLSKEDKNKMEQEAYHLYVEFMYQTYPPGFGIELGKGYQGKKEFDSAELFYTLKKKQIEGSEYSYSKFSIGVKFFLYPRQGT